jgi:hypothetical protein
MEKLTRLPLPWHYVMRLTEKLGAGPSRPVIFECVGVPGIIDGIIASAPLMTRIVVAGVCMQPDTIRPAMAINKEIDLRFVVGYSPLEFRDTLHLLADGKINAARSPPELSGSPASQQPSTHSPTPRSTPRSSSIPAAPPQRRTQSDPPAYKQTATTLQSLHSIQRASNFRPSLSPSWVGSFSRCHRSRQPPASGQAPNVATSTALMVCIRFSAWVKTTDPADSNTSSVTSKASTPKV